MSSFDDKLANHIRDKFDQYHEEVDPNGFDGLRGELLEYNATQKRIIYYRYLAAALVLLVLSGIFYWMDPLGNRSFDAESTLALQSPPTNASGALPDSANDVGSGTDLSDSLSGNQSSRNSELLHDQLVNAAPENIDSTNDPSAPQNSVTDSLLTRNFAYSSPTPLTSHDGDTQLDELNSGYQTSSLNTIDKISLSEFQAENFVSSELLPIRDGLKKSEILDHVESHQGVYAANLSETTILTDENADFIVVPRQKDAQSTQVLFGSTVNFMRDHDAQGTGFLAGAMHQFRINNTVSISMGGLFSVNELHFSNDAQDQSTVLSNIPDIVAAGGNVNFNYARDFDIKYTALDIPLNAKINLGAFRNGQYNFAIGLSSLWYIQQSLVERGTSYKGFATMDGETGNISVSISSSDYEMTRKPQAFNQFDFAKLMNISLGYASLRNYESFELELYVKYPLGNITEGDYLFGMGGVTLKYKL